jgi:hypothetical protein
MISEVIVIHIHCYEHARYLLQDSQWSDVVEEEQRAFLVLDSTVVLMTLTTPVDESPTVISSAHRITIDAQRIDAVTALRRYDAYVLAFMDASVPIFISRDLEKPIGVESGLRGNMLVIKWFDMSADIAHPFR